MSRQGRGSGGFRITGTIISGFSELRPGVQQRANPPMIPNPHDALVKVVFGKPEHAQGMLRALQALLERELGPEAKEAIMTAGQQIREEGRQEGRREGECALLLRLLRRRFGTVVNADIEQRIARASIEQIDTWGERMLSAATLTELLAD